jgi:3',5'-cyclic AMP phosphodiesterase CpdA
MTEAVMRLVHFSDLHFAPGQMGPLQRRLAAQAFSPVLGPLFQKLEAGLAPHDPKALRPLRDSIVQCVGDPNSPYVDRTYLVVTGDLTTWGDHGSMQSALSLIDVIAMRAGLPKIVLYGNHDVWPGVPGRTSGLPIAASDSKLDSARSALRQHEFPVDYSREVAAAPFAGGTRRLVLWEIDTVQHERWANFLAEGQVRRDRYWETRAPVCQLDTLQRMSNPADVVVALTHHPVHHVPDNVTLQDRNTVASEFAKPPRGNVRRDPLVQVVVSGHTHHTYPEDGFLPLDNPAHVPLTPKQAQLTIGTVAQAPFASMRQHHWQLLHIDYDDANKELVIERLLFKWDGFGDYQPDVDRGTGQPRTEQIRLACD